MFKNSLGFGLLAGPVLMMALADVSAVQVSILLSLTIISGTVLTAAGVYGIIGYGKSLIKSKDAAIVEKK